jgi:peptidoglycan hydrolase CwlO-like protein
MTKESRIKVCKCNKESEISEIHTIVKRTEPKLDSIDSRLTNVEKQISYSQGSNDTWKWIAGGGGLIGIIALAISIIGTFI